MIFLSPAELVVVNLESITSHPGLTVAFGVLLAREGVPLTPRLGKSGCRGVDRRRAG